MDRERTAGPLRRDVLAATGTVGAGLLAGCLTGGSGETDGSETSGSGDGTDTMADGTETSGDWQSVDLSAVRGSETFTIGGLDAPVVVQSFAVWCPKCQRQSDQIAGLDDSVTRVGLNIDPNEDSETVQQHAEDNGFDWRFAVAPTAMTESLVEEFGPTVTNAPSTPVIVVCDDGATTFMSGSIQSPSDITAATEDC